MKVSWPSYWWLVNLSKLLCVQLSHLPKCWLMRKQQTTRQMKSAPSEKQLSDPIIWNHAERIYQWENKGRDDHSFTLHLKSSTDLSWETERESTLLLQSHPPFFLSVIISVSQDKINITVMTQALRESRDREKESKR